MHQTFNCPNCGGAVQYNGTDLTARCQYCSTIVQVPEELRQASLNLQASKTASRSMKYFLIFIIIVVVVPTCIGVFGSIIGIVVGIVVPILAVMLPFLFK